MNPKDLPRVHGDHERIPVDAFTGDVKVEVADDLLWGR
jgi:hypothetical protein